MSFKAIFRTVATRLFGRSATRTRATSSPAFQGRTFQMKRSVTTARIGRLTEHINVATVSFANTSMPMLGAQAADSHDDPSVAASAAGTVDAD